VAPDILSSDHTNPENAAAHATPVVPSTRTNDDEPINLYSIEHSKDTKNTTTEEIPFVHEICIHGSKGKVTTKALFDGGAMVSAMSTPTFNRTQHKLGSTRPSKHVLQMANGAVTPSQQRWEGIVELGNTKIKGEFEVFNSNGGQWEFLFGKPLL
jgi:hypothetical protein